MAVTMSSVHHRPSPGLSSAATKRVWGDDLLKLMIAPPPPSPRPEDQGTSMTTLDLLGCGSGSSSSSSCSRGPDLAGLELDMELPPPPSGWEKRLDLKAGKFYYVHLSTGRSTYDHPGFAKDALPQKTVLEPLRRPGEDLDLKLGSSSKPVHMTGRSLSKQMPRLGILTSIARTSCSSDSKRSEAGGIVLTSCKACLMYVMLSRLDPRCPKCGCHVAVESYYQPLQTKKQRIR